MYGSVQVKVKTTKFYWKKLFWLNKKANSVS